MWDPLCSPAIDDITKEKYATSFRIFVHIGDLLRYHRELQGHPSLEQWTSAAVYYKKATTLWPQNGHAYNQLAVLCTYKSDDFRTMYYYFRSLAVAIPFATSKENCLQLLERTRLKVRNILRLLNNFQREKTFEQRKEHSQRNHLLSLTTDFILLHGILFMNRR